MEGFSAGTNGYLSNCFAAPFNDHGLSMRVNSVEVAFALRKARVMNQPDIAAAVALLLTASRSAMQAKKLTGRRNMSGDTTVWDTVSEQAMRCLVFDKFTQTQLSRSLIGTGNDIIIEAVDWDVLARGGQGIWSAGISAPDLRRNIETEATLLYPGQNKLGEILMEVRTFLQAPGAFVPFAEYEYAGADGTWRVATALQMRTWTEQGVMPRNTPLRLTGDPLPQRADNLNGTTSIEHHSAQKYNPGHVQHLKRVNEAWGRSRRSDDGRSDM